MWPDLMAERNEHNMLSVATAHIDPRADTVFDTMDALNPLQRLIADAMDAAGMPHDARGSKAELSRRSGVPRSTISYIFSREAYLPETGARAALAIALGIPKADLDEAGAAIKGLRVHASGSRVIAHLNEVRSDLILAADELTPDELAAAQSLLDDLAKKVAERLRGPNGG